MTYKYIHFQDKSSIDGNKLEALSDNNKFLNSSLNSKTQGVLFKAGFIDSSLSVSSGTTYIINNKTFKVDADRYIKVSADIGYLESSVDNYINQEIIISGSSFINNTTALIQPRSAYSTVITPPKLILYTFVPANKINTDGTISITYTFYSSNSFYIRRYCQIIVEDMGTGY